MPEYFYHIGIELFESQPSAPINLSQAFRSLNPFASQRPRTFRDPKYDSMKPTTSHISRQVVPSSNEDGRIDDVFVEAQDTDDITAGIGTKMASVQTKAGFLLVEELATGERGIVHLYRDAEESPGLYHNANQVSSSDLWNGSATAKARAPSKRKAPPRDDDCTILSILAVPSYMTPKDFLAFVGADTRNAVSHFRMIRTSRLNRYMVLMKFKDGRFARQWQSDWNGRVFNSMEPETCHVVFVKSVEVFHNHDLQHNESSVLNNGQANGLDKTVSSRAMSTTAKPVAPPTPSLVELPTCPVCLERMDESTGLLTILCQHVFHCSCLEKWSGGGCPVCRYSQDDFSTRLSRSVKPKKHLNAHGEYDVDEDDLECGSCRTQQSLWQCVICGHVGCGRYAGKHAYRHFESTAHAFALDLESQRVWDYEHDCYVHRIIANGASTNTEKLIELPGRRREGQVTALEDSDRDLDVAKRENLAFEYTQLLTSQLESQRIYFEEIVARAVDKAREASKRAEKAAEDAQAVSSRLQEVTNEGNQLKVKSEQLEKDATRYQIRCQKLEASYNELLRKYNEEKTISDAVSKNAKETQESLAKRRNDLFKKQAEQIQILQQEIATKDFYLEALQEERRDLRLNLDMEKQLLNLVRTGQMTAGDLEGATIVTDAQAGKLRINEPNAGSSLQPKKQAKQAALRQEPTDDDIDKTIAVAKEGGIQTTNQGMSDLRQGLLALGFKFSEGVEICDLVDSLVGQGKIERCAEDLYSESESEIGSEVKGDAKEAAAKSKARKKAKMNKSKLRKKK